MGERAKVIAAVASAVRLHPLAGCPGKRFEMPVANLFCALILARSPETVLPWWLS